MQCSRTISFAQATYNKCLRATDCNLVCSLEQESHTTPFMLSIQNVSKAELTHALHVIQRNKKKRGKLVILYIQNNKKISVRKCLKICCHMGLSDSKVYGCWGVGGLASRGSCSLLSSHLPFFLLPPLALLSPPTHLPSFPPSPLSL